MTIATTAEQSAAQKSIQAWARASNPVAALRSGQGEFWRPHLQGIAELGATSVALPEEVGGVGGSIADLAAMLEQAATELVGGPVLTTAVAALVVGRSGDVAAKRWGPELAEGSPCGLVFEGAVAARKVDDGLILDGPAGVALGAGTGVPAVLLPADTDGAIVWCLVATDAPGVTVDRLEPLDPSVPLARIACEGVVVAADRQVHNVRPGLVTDLLATLAAAEAAGVAGWCLDTAVDYAKVREQFGSKIGSFQAIKHLCAGMLCRVESARAVAWDAAIAAEDDHDLNVAAAIAASVALDAAVETAKDCIQVLGGIGFTWEHDAHFYLRRATALRQLLGGSARWRARVVELTRSGARRRPGIDLSDREDERLAIRKDAEAVGALPEADRRAALAENGLLAPHWPEPYGRGADAGTQLLIADELARAGVVRPDIVIAGWALPTILEHGTPEQIDRHVLPSLRGDVIWCQLFSEPGAGSDLAAVRTSATRTDGGWILNGQKVWTSVAHKADWGICLARTNRDAPKHRGITYFLVDMRSKGIRIAPLAELTGEARFNEVFLDDVFVPDDCVVGSVDGGWKLANTTLANERVAIGKGSPLGDEMEALLASAPPEDPVAVDRLGTLVGEAMVGSLLEVRTAVRQLAGQGPGAESSVRKLIGVRYRQDVAEFAMETAGLDGAVENLATYNFLLTRCLSIAGGTTQVLLNVVAERILGLPR